MKLLSNLLKTILKLMLTSMTYTEAIDLAVQKNANGKARLTTVKFDRYNAKCNQV